MAVVITGGSRDVFIAIATAAAGLTGLLFVAITVTPRPANGRPHGVIHQVRSAAALLAFTNALGVTLFSLIPGNNPGYPTVAFGIVGVLFSLASVRSILGDPTARPRFLSQLTLIAGLLAVFITEIVYGFELLHNHHNQSAVDTIANVLVASILLGVARAWEFVGDRDTGIWASIAVLATGHAHTLAPPDTNPDPEPQAHSGGQ
jgi:hypothetical protein